MKQCKNCQVGIDWGRWCEDCSRMIGKTVATEALGAVVGYIILRLLSRVCQ